jgi:hypothetical protein
MLGFLEWNRGGRIVLMGFDVIWTDEGGVAREEGKKREPQIEDYTAAPHQRMIRAADSTYLIYMHACSDICI